MANTPHQEQVFMERRYTAPYNWCAQPWSRMWRQKHGLWELAREFAGPIKGKRVLDAGCGDGWYTARMSKECEAVWGIDLSERAIAFAPAINPDAAFTSGSLTKLPYKDEQFDVIMSFQVIEHIPLDELPAAIGELARVLARDGTLVVTVPSKNRPLSRAHFQHFTPRSLADTLAAHFVLREAVGQERHTRTLHVIERLLQNRLWLLPGVAEWFNRSRFAKRWSKTSAEGGQNIVAAFTKRS